MERVLITMVFGAVSLSLAPAAVSQSHMAAAAPSSSRAAGAPAKNPDVPPLPDGKSTILGGAIHSVDPVRDELVLNVYGEKPMRILYDERTQIFRDGKKIPLRQLGPADHASVQTTLDGAHIFAVSVHILSQNPAGDYQGRVLSFNPEKGILTLTSAAGSRPFSVMVNSQTSFQRQGQSSFASVQSSSNDLVPGSLVNVKFAADAGRGVAEQVTVLAAPGATFLFSGTVTDLDMHTGALTVVDPRNNQAYRIHFDPTHEPAGQLRSGQHVRISADYDGTRYVATQIQIEQ